MADVKFEVVEFSLSTAAAGNTQDVTISGFGTPKAALFLYGFSSSGSSTPNIGVGYTDGSSQIVTGISIRDVNTSNITDRYHRSDAVIVDADNSFLLCQFSFNSFITDGIRLDIDDSISTTKPVTCVLIGGADVSNVYIGTKDDLGTTTSPVPVTGVGFTPDLILMSQVGSGTPPSHLSPAGILSFGAAINDGAATQKSSLISSLDGGSTSVNNSYVSSNATTGQVYNNALAYTGAVTSFDSDGFTVTPSANAGSDVFSFFCIKFSNSPDVALFDTIIPTLGNYAETGPGFTPDFGLIASVVGPTARDTLTSANTFGFSLAAFDTNNVYTSNLTSQDNETTGNAKNLQSNSLRILDDDGSTDAVVSSGYAFNADGWDFTLTTNPTSPLLGWGLAIGSGDGPPPVGIQEMYIKDGGIFVKYTPHVKVGGTFQEVDAYVLEGGTWKPVHEK